jgi:nitroimidazol reductase NimA-like FMN-containing flavoprotein (pyridoxamine 5'-phosphate oxidase superfamily)
MPYAHALDEQACERLLRAGGVGRVALSTPEGPHIVPVDYAVVDDTIVVRTTPYSLLGTHGRNTMLAFEVDHLDRDRQAGWSVVARGRSFAELDPEELARIRAAWAPRPWAARSRSLCLRLRWESLTGRASDGALGGAVGPQGTRENEYPGHRTLRAL